MADFFSNPAGFWALALLLPLLLLYMLRHRPVRRRVPSIALWQGAVQAQVSTSPFQRLRKSLSLLLMLLALAALVLALAGARVPGATRHGVPLTVVIDVGARMAAQDGAGTRLDAARQLARQAIEDSAASRVTVLAFDGGLLPLAPADSSPGVALAALDRLAGGTRGTETAALARAIEQLAAGADRNVVAIGDRDPGKFENARFLQVGNPLPNVAIVSAGMAEPVPGRLEISFGIELYGAQASQRVTIALERMVEGSLELVDARDETLTPGRRIASIFAVPEAGLYRGALRVEDPLAIDNFAWVRATALPVLPVQMDDAVPAPVRRALAAIAEGMGTIRLDGAGDNASAVLAGAAASGAQPRLPAAYIAPAHPPRGSFGDETTVSGTARLLPSLLWRGAGNPAIVPGRMRTLRFDGLLRPALEIDQGAAIALAERDGGLRDLVIGLPLTEGEGTFAGQPAFIIFWANWFDYVRGLLDPLPRGALSTRDALRVPPLGGREDFTVKPPGGAAVRLSPGAGIALEQPGTYVTSGLDTPVPAVGASLLDATESDLAPTAADNEAALAWISQGALNGERDALELAPWLALLGAALLITEWLLYRKRFPRRQQPAGPPSTTPRTRATRA